MVLSQVLTGLLRRNDQVGGEINNFALKKKNFKNIFDNCYVCFLSSISLMTVHAGKKLFSF